MARSPQLIIKGEKALIRKLKRLGDRRKVKKVMRRATSAAAQVVVRGVRQIWRSEAKDTGLSARSVTKKVISTKAGYTAIVGIDKAASAEVDGHTHVPANIDHLIELGFQHANGTTIPAVAPLRRGYANSRQAAMREFEGKAASDIEKEAAKR